MKQEPTLNHYGDTGGNDSHTARCDHCGWEGPHRYRRDAEQDWERHMLLNPEHRPAEPMEGRFHS